MTDSQTDGRTLAARYLKGLNDHDPDAVDGFVAVDYINHNPFVENGREANRAFWSSFFTAFPDIEATMDDLVVAGDRVVGRFTYRGTHDGPFLALVDDRTLVSTRGRVHDFAAGRAKTRIIVKPNEATPS